MHFSRSITLSLFLLPFPLLSTAFSFPGLMDLQSPPASSPRSPSDWSSSIGPRASATKKIWVIQDTYAGNTFFDGFTFFDQVDPTNGQVHYVNRSYAMGKLAYVTPNNKVVMQVDNFTHLSPGQERDSVRIQSKKLYNGGLFLLDVEQAPFGCGVWPAFWSTGENWPNGGEIDIMEGVHDNIHNQMTMHTKPGCYITNTSNNPFSGDVLSTDCNALINDNAGCAIVDASRASYGPQFNVLNGGVFAMMWTSDAITIWFFHRASIPHDIPNGAPDPTGWGEPSALIPSTTCDTKTYFNNHTLVFDITFCGDWAGPSYIPAGCPGNCSERIQDPSNFVNASWSINSLLVYRDASITGAVASGTMRSQIPRIFIVTSPSLLASFGVLWVSGLLGLTCLWNSGVI